MIAQAQTLPRHFRSPLRGRGKTKNAFVLSRPYILKTPTKGGRLVDPLVYMFLSCSSLLISHHLPDQLTFDVLQRGHQNRHGLEVGSPGGHIKKPRLVKSTLAVTKPSQGFSIGKA